MSALATTSARATRAGSFTGTGVLLRTSLKHDGRRLVPWIAIGSVLAGVSVMVYPWVFRTAEARAGLAAAVGSNPALGLIFGPAYDVTTAEGFNAWRALPLCGFIAALAAIFAVTRATRAQEDSGQAELLASGVLGRSSRLLVGTAVALIGTAVLGLVGALATVAFGGGWESSLLLGATITATGWMFAAVAAVAAQLGSDTRTANSMAVGTLGTLFLLRGFAYSVDAPRWTQWANPMSWMVETRPATGDHWWPLLLAIALTVVLLVVAFTLEARRDFGQGAIKPGPGPARGRDRTPLRLAVRLNRGQIVTWTIAFVMLGVVFGYFATSVSDLFGSDSSVQQLLGGGGATQDGLVTAFVVMILSLVGIIAAIPGVQIVLKIRSEELEDRVEPLMATATTRGRYLTANVVLALLAPSAFVLLAGAVIAVLASGAGIGVGFGDVLLQSVATIPAVWTVVAVPVAVLGARPRLTLAAWFGVIASFVLTLLGPTFGLDDWVLGIAPFWHVPDVTAASPDWTGLGWVTLVTAALLALGFAGFRRRDLAR